MPLHVVASISCGFCESVILHMGPPVKPGMKMSFRCHKCNARGTIFSRRKHPTKDEGLTWTAIATATDAKRDGYAWSGNFMEMDSVTLQKHIAIRESEVADMRAFYDEQLDEMRAHYGKVRREENRLAEVNARLAKAEAIEIKKSDTPEEQTVKMLQKLMTKYIKLGKIKEADGLRLLAGCSTKIGCERVFNFMQELDNDDE